MKFIDHYLSVSSVHGLRYLTPGNGCLIRLSWALAITTALIICTIMVQQGIKENQENPVATSITNVPVSTMPFPAVTFIPLNQDYDYGFARGIVEKALNHFPFDCSASGFGNHSLKEAFDCLEKVSKVKSAFFGHFELNTTKSWAKFKDIIISDDSLTSKNLAQRFLCKSGILPFLNSIPKYFVELLQNDTLDVDFFSEYLLHPLNQSVPKIESELKSIMMSTKRCYVVIQKTPKERINEVLMNILALGQPNAPFYLGTFLRTVDRRKFQTIIKGKVESVMNLVNFSLVKGRKMSTDHYKEIVDYGSLLIDPFMASDQKYFYAIAKKIISELGLEEKMLFKRETPNFHPILWLCKDDTGIETSCFHFMRSFTHDGLGFTMSNKNWDELFYVQSPLSNENIEENIKIPSFANEEMTIYLQFPYSIR